MRHRLKGRKLGRTASHKKATLRALATQLLKYKKIRTTHAKAKETQRFVEPLITRAKSDTIANRRYIYRFIKDSDVLSELFGDVAEKVRERNGGYTRVVKLGARVGDAADMSIIELVDYNEVAKPKKAKKETAKETAEEPKAKKASRKKKEEVKDAEVIEEVKTKEEAATVDGAEAAEEVKEEPEVKAESSDAGKEEEEEKK